MPLIIVKVTLYIVVAGQPLSLGPPVQSVLLGVPMRLLLTRVHLEGDANIKRLYSIG